MFNRNSDIIICPHTKPISNSFFARGNFCCLLITFANSFDPDQDQQNVSPDLDPNCLTLLVFRKDFFEKVNFEKNRQMTTKA